MENVYRAERITSERRNHKVAFLIYSHKLGEVPTLNSHPDDVTSCRAETEIFCPLLADVITSLRRLSLNKSTLFYIFIQTLCSRHFLASCR